MRQALTFIAFILLTIGGVHAQTGVVRGIVRDADSREPLAGANIILSGSSTGTATDVNGSYRLDVPVTRRF